MGRAYSETPFQLWVFAAFFLSFAIKVPMFPFHTWLPAAHVEAPTAGSVILASVLLKMGTYGFLRFCLPITPHATHVFAPVCPVALRRRHPLRRPDRPGADRPQEARRLLQRRPHGLRHPRHLRPQPPGIEGAVLQMINHGITTGALFICVGLIYERLHTRDLNAAAGVGKFMPVFAGLFGVFCLSSSPSPAPTASSANSSCWPAASPRCRRSRSAPCPASCSPRPTCCACCSASPGAAPNNPDHHA
jgi:NADH-quinone oxidoreductase subunit M